MTDQNLPQEPEAATIKVKIIKKVVLRFAKDVNDQGKPIMMIYPKNSPLYYPWRIIYQYNPKKDTIFEVFSKKVEADAGLEFWQLASKMKVKDPKNLKNWVLLDMYVRADETKKV